MDTQLKILKYPIENYSSKLWYPIENADTQFTKKWWVFTQCTQILIWSYAIFGPLLQNYLTIQHPKVIYIHSLSQDMY